MTKCEHIELSTDDPKRASAFYTQLFGWKVENTPDPDNGMDYLMFRTDNGGGGITGKMAPEQPTAWMPYFTVASVESTLARAGALGAQVRLGLTPIGEMGAIAVLADPTGAVFGIWETRSPAPTKKAKPAKAKKPAAKPKAKAKQPAPKAKKKKR